MQNTTERECTKCHKVKPWTEEYFYFQPSLGRWRQPCIDCSRKQGMERERARRRKKEMLAKENS